MFSSTYVLTFCFGLSLQTKDCFKCSGLLIRGVLGRLVLHYALENTHLVLRIIGILHRMGTKIFKLQD